MKGMVGMASMNVRWATLSLVLMASVGCAGEEVAESSDNEELATTEQATIADLYRMQQLTARREEIEFQVELIRLRLIQLNAEASQLTLTCSDVAAPCASRLADIAREVRLLQLRLFDLQAQYSEVVAEIEALKKSVDRSIDRDFKYSA